MKNRKLIIIYKNKFQAQSHLNDLQHPSISFDDNDDSVVVTPQTPVVSSITPVDLSATLNEGSIPVL